MKLEEIKNIAKQQGVKVSRMKKSELVRAIQVAEGNPPCFETRERESCGQDNCLWRGDCR